MWTYSIRTLSANFSSCLENQNPNGSVDYSFTVGDGVTASSSIDSFDFYQNFLAISATINSANHFISYRDVASNALQWSCSIDTQTIIITKVALSGTVLIIIDDAGTLLYIDISN